MKRHPMALLVAVALVASFALQAGAETVKITQLMMPHHYNWTKEYYEAMAARFEASHPGVEIEVIPAAGRPDFEEKVIVGSAAGVIFDVLVPPALSWALMAGEDMFVDMKPYVERDPDISLDQFLPVSLTAQSMGGRLLGLPLSVSTIAANVNVQMFREAGLQTPLELGDEWNWDAMSNIALKLAKDVNGDGTFDRFGLSSRPMYSRLIPLVVHNAGGDALDAQVDPHKSTFLSDPAVEEGLRYFIDLTSRGLVSWRGAEFREGTAGIDLSQLPESTVSFIRDAGNPFEFEVAPYPRGPARQGSEVLAFSYSIHRDSKHKDLAWEWIKFLETDRESVDGVMSAWGNPTAYKPYLRDYFELFPEAPPSLSVYADILQSPDARVQPVTPAYVDIRREFNSRIKPVLSGEESLGNFLQTIDPIVQNLLDKVWAK